MVTLFSMSTSPILSLDDVASMVKQLKTRLGIGVYWDSLLEDFAQLGDITGVFVLAKKGRLWVPNKQQPAVVSPVQVGLLGAIANSIELEPYPYTLEMIPLP